MYYVVGAVRGEALGNFGKTDVAFEGQKGGFNLSVSLHEVDWGGCSEVINAKKATTKNDDDIR